MTIILLNVNIILVQLVNNHPKEREKQMEEITACFQKLDNGEMAVICCLAPDIIFPIKGFEPKEGAPYTFNKVRHPESPRFEYKGKKYVVCTALPI